MKPRKRKRLEAAGWRVGDAAEFLGLSGEERALLELRLALADEVRHTRTSQGTTQAQLAERLGSSQSRVAKLEAGDPSVSADLLLRALFALGVSMRDLAEVVASLKGVGGRGGARGRSRRRPDPRR